MESVVPLRPSVELRLVAFVSWLLIMAAYFWLPVWALYGKVPGRTQGSLYTIFLLGWIINVVLWMPARSAGQVPLRDRSIDFLRVVFCGILVLGMFEQGNFRLAVRELKNHRLQDFYREHQAWQGRIRDAKQRGELDVVLPAIQSWPQILNIGATLISEDPMNSRNMTTALYFGLRSICVSKPDALVTPP
jgi:hypothetical protein